MADYVIEKLDIADYKKCGNIWNMKNNPNTDIFYSEIVSGNRIVYIYKKNGVFIGEIALVFDKEDLDYTIPGQRVYVSHLVVKRKYRNHGIGGTLIDFIIGKAKELGFKEMSIGVDKDNTVALNLYRHKGFTNIIFEGADEMGEYYKLVKYL